MENNYILTSDGELYHWGVKGMKWGVRRYQNADGSLTGAGKKRYAKAPINVDDIKNAPKKGWGATTGDQDNAFYYEKHNNKLYVSDKIPKNSTRAQQVAAKNQVKKKIKTETWSEDAKEAARIKKKKVNEMSNAELQKLNNRQNLERQHAQLNPGAVRRGIAAVAATAAFMGTILKVYNNSDKMVAAGKRITKKVLKHPLGIGDMSL